MKVSYQLKQPADLKQVKEWLKPYGGRCAKIQDGTLEYQVKEENEVAAWNELTERGLI